MGVYFRRAVKYFIFLCVIYLAVMAAMYFTGNLAMPVEADFWQTLNMQLFYTEKGRLMLPAVLLLALCYPRFGFVLRVVSPCSFVENFTQIENAFKASGFRLVERSEREAHFESEGLWQSLGYLKEDRVVVRQVENGVEIEGIRRATVKIVWRLDGYMSHLKNE